MVKDDYQNIHAGHRQRLRERIAKSGLDSLQDHEILEYLLFFTRPHVNTNEIAHRLLREFGSLDRVFEADTANLAEVKGVGSISAQFLSLIPALARRYQLSKHRLGQTFHSVGQIVAHLSSYFIGVERELLVVLALDSERALLHEEVMTAGSRTEVTVSIRRLMEIALKTKASAMVVAHNHLTRNPKPSLDDIQMTRELMTSLRRIEVTLIDHLILCQGDDYYSFAEEGQI